MNVPVAKALLAGLYFFACFSHLFPISSSDHIDKATGYLKSEAHWKLEMLPQERQWQWKESELGDIITINNTVLYCYILKYWYASNKKLDENALAGEFVDWYD